MVHVRDPTVRGPICHFWGADSWAPDNRAPGPSCPGPNLSLFQGEQLGPGQLGPEPIGICHDIFDDLRIFFLILRCHFNSWDGVHCIFDVASGTGVDYFVFLMVHLIFWTVNLIF